MQPTQLPADPRHRVGGLSLLLVIGALFVGWSPVVRGSDFVRIKPTIYSYIHDLPRTVRADHPAILPVAAAIRAVTTDPLEQLVVVNDVTHLLVDYDEDQRVYGVPEHYATLDEMIAKRRQEGWLYLRDDCDGRAVFAAHLLAALGIPWRLEASYWKHHAWVIARVGGVDYDLLDFRRVDKSAPSLGYRLVGHWFVRESRPPPFFDWRQRWAERTGRDLTTGLRLGLLALNSTPGALHERHATDWTELSPGDLRSPVNPRELTTAVAGFPLGEASTPHGLAAALAHVPVAPSAPAPDRAADSKPGLATNSSSSAPAVPLARR